MLRTRVRLPSSPLSVIPPKEGLPTQTPIRTGSDLDAFAPLSVIPPKEGLPTQTPIRTGSDLDAFAPLTRQPEGECTSPDPANLILSYQEIAVPKL